jgi:hypothetical protein
MWWRALVPVVVLTACGSTGGEPRLAGTVPPVESIAPDPTLFHDTATEYCDGTGDARIEMAFVGTVIARDDSVDPAWVVFAVTEWFTNDYGTEIALWAPDWDGRVGGRWLVASSLYGVEDRHSGDLFACATVQFDQEIYEDWLEQYDGSVVAGAAVSEREGDPADIARIEAGRERWDDVEPDEYAYTVHAWDRFTEARTCGEGELRISVIGGEVSSVRDLTHGCDLDKAGAILLDDLFDRAIAAAGAVEVLEIDPDWGFVAGFYGHDRSIDLDVSVYDFSTNVGVPATSDDARTQLQEARQRWEDAGITSYVVTVDPRCFCGFEGPYTVTVVDEVVTDVVGPSADSVIPDDIDLTIDGIFDQISILAYGDRVEATFDEELGYPLTAYLDPDLDTADDELTFVVSNLLPLD